MYIIRNLGRNKNLPGTKTQPKFLGHYVVESVTEGHVVVSGLGSDHGSVDS